MRRSSVWQGLFSTTHRANCTEILCKNGVDKKIYKHSHVVRFGVRQKGKKHAEHLLVWNQLGYEQTSFPGRSL